MEKKKIVAIGIIILFIGVAVAPSITQSIAKADYDDDHVVITTQACGIRGYEDATITISKEQYQDLEQYLTTFREQLNQTSTRQEIIILSMEAVVELERYGLLPKGMGVEQAQRLVTAGGQFLDVPMNLKNSFSQFINSFCFFVAITYNVIDYNGWVVLAAFLSQFIDYDSPFIYLVYLFFFIGFWKPLRFLNTLVAMPEEGAFNFYFTLGLNGISGGMDDIKSVLGFTGLKIRLTDRNAFYLGVAFAVIR
jgi:hypothetical protein